MSQSLCKSYLHLVFSTKHRSELIKEQDLPEMFSFIAGIINENDCSALQVGGTTNHIHALFLMSKNRTIKDIVCKIKSNSSRWIKTKGEFYSIFDWQDGYGAFSVSYNRTSNVASYIRNQKKHHEMVDFKEEFLYMLNEAGIEYDEKYLWD